MLDSGAWIAIGTGVLAAGTLVLARVTVKTATADRRHNDEKRPRIERAMIGYAGRHSTRRSAASTAQEDYEARQVLLPSRRKSTRA